MRRLRPEAFTLVEVLGSLAILAGAIVGIILCSADGLAASRQIERNVKSALVAESEMERIKGSLAHDFDQAYVDTHVNLGDGFCCKGTVEDVTGSPELKYIKVMAGYDTNGNGNLGGNEVLVVLNTYTVDGL